jgi:catechol 2,3-dioxygenase-like lactoylglutathione lyase family enzyme
MPHDIARLGASGAGPRRRLAGTLVLCVLCGWLVALVSRSAPEAAGQAEAVGGAELPRARFHHVHINSVDPESHVGFYAARFQSSASRFADRPALSVDGMWFLFNAVAERPPSDPVSGFWHIGWGAPDMPGTYAALRASGTTFQTPLTNAGMFLQGKPGPLDFMYAYGPGGEWIELYTTSNSTFHHIHLLSADPPAAEAWYLKYFGTPNGVPRKGPGGIWIGDLNLLAAGTGSAIVPAAAKGAKTFASPRGRVLDHFAFAVPDLDRTLARLKADGVTVLRPPATLFGGVLRSAFVMAPDNVELELVQEMSR